MAHGDEILIIGDTLKSVVHTFKYLKYAATQFKSGFLALPGLAEHFFLS